MYIINPPPPPATASTVTLGDGGLQRRGIPRRGGGLNKKGGSYPSPHYRMGWAFDSEGGS